MDCLLVPAHGVVEPARHDKPECQTVAAPHGAATVSHAGNAVRLSHHSPAVIVKVTTRLHGATIAAAVALSV